MSRKKPHKDFPLFPHQNGQWAKKMRGKLYYFGTDAEDALREYNRVKDDLQAGRAPTPHDTSLTLEDLCDEFLDVKLTLAESGELSRRTWNDYRYTGQVICDLLGKHRQVVSLKPADFVHLREKLAETRGPIALGNQIQRVRTILKYAYDAGLIENPVRFGPTFKKPPRKLIRKQRQESGPKMFHVEELREIIRKAPHNLKAMVLLGVNCGFGQTDISSLPLSAIQGDWIEFPRPKTSVPRRCPLWPESSEALNAYMQHRPRPRPGFENLVFLTRLGQPWLREYDSGHHTDNISKRFRKLLKELGIHRERISFYALRHITATIGNEAKDPLAVDFIMGHLNQDMGSNYRHDISDERLLAVTNAIRDWLYPRFW